MNVVATGVPSTSKRSEGGEAGRPRRFVSHWESRPTGPRLQQSLLQIQFYLTRSRRFAPGRIL